MGTSVVAGASFARLDTVGRSRVVAAAGVAALVSGPLLARYHLLLVLTLAAVALSVAGAQRGRWRVPLLVALLAAVFWTPAPGAWSPGWGRLLDLPRVAAALAFWGALVPWAQRPLRLRGAAVVLGLAALAGARAAGSVVVDPDPAVPLEVPGLPLVAADLQRDGDRLVPSGLPGAGHPAAGAGWARLSVDPSGGPPRWEAAAGQHRFASPTEPGEAASTPGPDGGRLEVREQDGQTDVWFVPRSGAATRLTQHPAHDVGPVWDPSRRRIWFLSDRGVGVRALRVWWLPWTADR